MVSSLVSGGGPAGNSHVASDSKGAGGSLVVAIVAENDRAIQTFRFDPGDDVVFGRAEADVTLDDRQCSRHHFRLANADGACALRDLGSSNGTYLNGERVMEATLGAGDVINVGSTLITLRGNLSSPAPQVMLEIRGVRDAMPAIGDGTDWRALTGKTIDFSHLAKQAVREKDGAPSGQPPASFLPGVWQVCGSVFDSPTSPPRMQRLVEAVVSLGGAARAAMVLSGGESGKPVILAEATSDDSVDKLPIIPDLVNACSRPGIAVSIPNITQDSRYRRLAGERLPVAGVVYAAVASLSEVHGVLYAEWRGKADLDMYFLWTWSVAGQVGLLIDRNALAARLERTNETLEKTVEDRTHDLAIALDRLSAANEMMQHTGKLAIIGELAANLVHELNTPLTVVLGYAQLIGLKLGEDCKEVEQLSAQATRMRRIVGNVLSLSRRQKPEIHPTSLRETLATVRELIAYELGKNRVTLRVELPDDLPRIKADSVQLEHVFLNLIVNACQAMDRERGGEIVVSARAANKRVTVKLQDNGPGIPKEIIGRIFEPFFTTKPTGKGTGLGLAIAHRMLQEQGATIAAANAPEGGAVFTLTFDQSGSTVSGMPRPAELAPPAEAPPTVLVVNGDEDLCQMLTSVLERDGCRARSTSSADEAFELLTKLDFDVVVVSVGDPLGGLALIEKAREANTDIVGKAVVIAADSPSADERRTMQILRARLVQGTAAYSRLGKAVLSAAAARR